MCPSIISTPVDERRRGWRSARVAARSAGSRAAASSGMPRLIPASLAWAGPAIGPALSRTDSGLTNGEESAKIESMAVEVSAESRSALHAALADPRRLHIVDELAVSDRSPSELRDALSMGSNLLTHHLDVLESVGVVERLQSSADGRRRYVRLRPEVLASIAGPVETLLARHILFVCRANSARSQLAAALWNARHEVPASSAGTEPADAVSPLAIDAAGRAGLDLTTARPRSLEEVSERPDLVVTVCDIAREDLPRRFDRVRSLHWSISDPVEARTADAFDEALQRIDDRVRSLADVVELPSQKRSSA